MLFFIDCPAGFYGTNCSEVCPTPYYGNGCIKKCECSPCHHIHGCISLTTMHGKHAKQMDMINNSRVSQSKSNYT